MPSEDGSSFVKSLAAFVRRHELALVEASHLQKARLDVERQPVLCSTSPTLRSSSIFSATCPRKVSSLVASLSLVGGQPPHIGQPAKLTLTPHHLFFLLSQFSDFGVEVGPMNVRLEDIHARSASANYVSFLNARSLPVDQRASSSDTDSIHSVSSIQSVLSNVSNLWNGLGSASLARSQRLKADLETEIQFVLSAFTRVRSLRISQDRRARLVKGFEEFPFDTAVPLHVFRNLVELELYDTDFRQLYGWDRLSEQLQSLTIKRGNIEDPKDLFESILYDDMERRRRRSSKPQPAASPSGQIYMPNLARDASNTSVPSSPLPGSLRSQGSCSCSQDEPDNIASPVVSRRRGSNVSPPRLCGARCNSTASKSITAYEMQRTGSRSSSKSAKSSAKGAKHRRSSSMLSGSEILASKWQLLRHLSLADNGLDDSLDPSCFLALARSLVSLDLSSNLFSSIPDALSMLSRLRALNLANCRIRSLDAFRWDHIASIELLNLRQNHLENLIGLCRPRSLVRVDLRENRLKDPDELGPLTKICTLREVFVSGNPFIKTHADYRLQIFNLFRASGDHPGDILIDGSGPSSSERRHLRDRAFQSSSTLQVHTQNVSLPRMVYRKNASSHNWRSPAALGVQTGSVQQAVGGLGIDNKASFKTQIEKRRETPPNESKDINANIPARDAKLGYYAPDSANETELLGMQTRSRHGWSDISLHAVTTSDTSPVAMRTDNGVHNHVKAF